MSVPAPLPPPSEAPVTPRRRWLAWVIGLLLIAALTALAWYLVQRSQSPTPGAAGGPPGAGRGGPGAGGPGAAGGGSVTVGAARAVQGELPVTIDALGTVTPPVTVTLQPQIGGVLTDVSFTEGQMVTKGQVLARIDARPYEQSLAQARAQRARDEAQLTAARQTLGRYQTLWKQDSIARQDVDTQAALVKQLEAVVQADRASEQAAQLNVNYATIRAPISGRIGLRAVDPGNVVAASSASGIASITQVDPIDVVFAVPQDRVQDVQAAQKRGALPVTVFDRDRSDKLAEGRFLTLDNVINTATGTVRAKARFANAGGQLFANQFVNVRLQLGNVSGVLVPVTAVRTGPQGDYVYVIDEERVAHMRPVTRGLATVDQMLITKGLQPGERVVTEGGDRVKDGGKVQLAGQGGGAGGPRSRASAASGAAAAAGAPGGAGSAAGGAPQGAVGAGAAGVGAAVGEAGRWRPAPPASGASGAAGSQPNTPQVGTASRDGATNSVVPAAPASAASRPAWFDRLPPDVQEKIKAMPPEERRAYIQQLREQRRAPDGQ